MSAPTRLELPCRFCNQRLILPTCGMFYCPVCRAHSSVQQNGGSYSLWHDANSDMVNYACSVPSRPAQKLPIEAVIVPSNIGNTGRVFGLTPDEYFRVYRRANIRCPHCSSFWRSKVMRDSNFDSRSPLAHCPFCQKSFDYRKLPQKHAQISAIYDGRPKPVSELISLPYLEYEEALMNWQRAGQAGPRPASPASTCPGPIVTYSYCSCDGCTPIHFSGTAGQELIGGCGSCGQKARWYAVATTLSCGYCSTKLTVPIGVSANIACHVCMRIFRRNPTDRGLFETDRQYPEPGYESPDYCEVSAKCPHCSKQNVESLDTKKYLVMKCSKCTRLFRWGETKNFRVERIVGKRSEPYEAQQNSSDTYDFFPRDNDERDRRRREADERLAEVHERQKDDSARERENRDRSLPGS